MTSIASSSSNSVELNCEFVNNSNNIRTQVATKGGRSKLEVESVANHESFCSQLLYKPVNGQGVCSRRTGFVLNPCSGAGRACEEWKTLINDVDKIFGNTYTTRVTTGQYDAMRITIDLIEQGYNLIVSVGGDGTHNEVVNGYMRANGFKKGIEFGILPIGSGSDFQKTIFEQGGETTLSSLDKLKLLKNGYSVLSDVGFVRCTPLNKENTTSLDTYFDRSSQSPTTDDDNQSGELVSSIDGMVERYFINMSGCGIGGAVCHGVNSSSKSLGGFVTFCYETVKVSLTWRNQPIRWRFSKNDEWQRADVYMFVLGNGKYQGGGMKPTPNADPTDGLLDLVVIKDFGMADVLKIPHVYSGDHFRHRTQVSGTRITDVYAEPEHTHDPVWIEADGETPGKLPASWHLYQNAIRIIVPPSFYQS